MKEVFSKKIITIESLTIFLPVIVFLIIGRSNENPEFVVNLVSLALLCTLFIFRNDSIRHMYFGFIFLLLTLIGNVFGFNNFVYISASLALSMFVLGILNMFLFYSKS